MKKIIAFIALMMISGAAMSQTRGTYGTFQPWATQAGTLYKANGTAVASGKLDTLSNTDTGYARFTFNANYSFLFTFNVTKISGTVGGALQLQASTDGTNWQSVIGDTASCITCIGATGTVTNTAGTKGYTWVVPQDKMAFPYWQVRIISTGTMTASYTGSAGYKY